MFSILLVEDAPEYQTMVAKILGHHRVITTDDPDQVKLNLEEYKIDLILLDITLPKRDGYTVLHDLQSHPEFQDIPVICLTGKNQVTDKVTAFSLGADDFIQKPFDPIEFRAKIDSKLTKRARNKEASNLVFIGSLTLDMTSHCVYVSTTGKEIVLTNTEFKILHQLGKKTGQVLTREQLLSSVWGDEGAVFDRAVDVHICSLRKKISPYDIQFKSVAGVGYRLDIAQGKSKFKEGISA